MIQCPICGDIDSKVIDSRSMDDGVRRRRQCLGCGNRFTTCERIQSKNVFVIKKDGRRENYNREKLLAGIRKACEKRPLQMGTIDKLVDSVESEIYTTGKTEISSSVIGDRVIQKLAELDHIAYIRFASVYRDFEDITDMKQAVDDVLTIKETTPPVEQLFLMEPDAINRKNGGKERKRGG
jgi:transcriptional repressor NrdR